MICGRIEMNINRYNERFIQLKAEKSLLKTQYKQLNSKLKAEKDQYLHLLEAQEIIKEVVQEVQNKLKIHISDIVNLAIDSVPFPKKPDYFDIEFVQKRNQIEGDIYIVQNGIKMNPIQSSGGGLLDIISFGLQIACWSLQIKKKSNTIILDEPFKNINDPNNEMGLKEFVCEMLKKISDKLKIQFIIIGSNNDFTEIGDKVFKVFLNEESISQVKQINV